MANKETNYKRYAIVVGTEEDGSRTLEDYTSLEDAMKAYEFIKKNGYHLTENDGDKVEFEDSPRIDFNIDAELWSESGAHKGFESIEGVSPFSFVDFNSKDKTWTLEEIKNEKHFSIHEVSKNTFVKSKEFDSYLEAEDEFERINKEHNISSGVRFIASNSNDLKELPSNKKALDSAIPLEEYEEAQKADQFNYMMLGRLKQDCDYFLGNGNGHEKHLWADNLEDHIKEMEKLHNAVRFKPDYLTKEDIQKYKTDMCKLKLEQEKDNPNFITEKNLPFYYEAMSKDDLLKQGDLVNNVFQKRIKTVASTLNLTNWDIRENCIEESPELWDDNTLSLSIFNVPDTLEPIDTYIEKVANSYDYKKFFAFDTYLKIQEGREISPSEYTKIDLDSEAFKALSPDIKTTITDYINEQSDKIVNAALEEEKLKQEQAVHTTIN